MFVVLIMQICSKVALIKASVQFYSTPTRWIHGATPPACLLVPRRARYYEPHTTKLAMVFFFFLNPLFKASAEQAAGAQHFHTWHYTTCLQNQHILSRSTKTHIHHGNRQSLRRNQNGGKLTNWLHDTRTGTERHVTETAVTAEKRLSCQIIKTWAWWCNDTVIVHTQAMPSVSFPSSGSY